MTEFKSLLQSRTIWANAIGLVALLMSLLGFQPPVLDREHLVDAILQIVAGGSFVASTVFRIFASKKIAL
jgi:hypothetical protein